MPDLPEDEDDPIYALVKDLDRSQHNVMVLVFVVVWLGGIIAALTLVQLMSN